MMSLGGFSYNQTLVPYILIAKCQMHMMWFGVLVAGTLYSYISIATVVNEGISCTASDAMNHSWHAGLSIINLFKFI